MSDVINQAMKEMGQSSMAKLRAELGEEKFREEMRRRAKNGLAKRWGNRDNKKDAK